MIVQSHGIRLGMISAVMERGKMKIRDILQAILDGKEDDIEVVVRCKDCKKCEKDTIFHDYWCNGNKIYSENNYCSYGERKDETDKTDESK